MKKILLLLSFFAFSAFGNELDDLLLKLKQENITQQKQARQKEADFLAQKNIQQQTLQALRTKIKTLQKSISVKEAKEKINDENISTLQDELSIKSESLEELFGVVKLASKDLYATSKNSLLRAQYPLDKEFLHLVNSKVLPNAKELEVLWTTYLDEIVNLGKISSFKTLVTLKNGKEQNLSVTRVGGFTVFSDGRFLDFHEDTNSLYEYPKQPTSYLKYTKNSNEEIQNILIDPTKGSLLNLESLKPNLKERILQAGSVGYVIIFLGIFGVILALFQLTRLFLMSSKIKKQMKNLSTLNADNPLGRVLLSIANETNEKTLETKLSQAVLKEMPKIDSIKNFIKLLAGVAPMLGLLGTVIGMIATFQAITLFGTGDPKLMAGGISQALITTVLGLVVAIPLLFLYSIINSYSQTILQIIYEQSAGLISKKVK